MTARLAVVSVAQAAERPGVSVPRSHQRIADTYHDDFVMPGSSPRWAMVLRLMRDRPTLPT